MVIYHKAEPVFPMFYINNRNRIAYLPHRENFFRKIKNNTCFFRQGVLLYQSCRETAKQIRVWRSLVSRLNGVQEASSSNLDTRTKSRNGFMPFLLFLFGEIQTSGNFSFFTFGENANEFRHSSHLNALKS